MPAIDVHRLRGYTRGTLWIWPSITVAVALLAGTLLSTVSTGPSPWLFRGDGSAGRTVLTALVGGLVTALSVVFSITIVGLQTVHSQYSPRLLRNFIQDLGAQVTLATFAGVSAYLLAVVRQIPPAGSSMPVPRLAITLGMLLFLLCVGVVAYYAQHITHSIRVSSAMDRVVDDALRIGDARAASEHADSDQLPVPPAGSHVVAATGTGYMQGVDMGTLAELAVERALIIRLRPMVGDAVVAGSPIAWTWPADGPSAVQQGVEAADPDRRIADAVRIGRDRELDRDFTYGLRQLVDVAIRAMSPSLNDPYTAVEAVDHLTAMLCRLTEQPLGARVHRDGQGRVIVAQPGPDLATCVELACDQIRRYGGHEPAVAVRLLLLLREVGVHGHPDLRPTLQGHVRRIVQHAEATSEHDEVQVVRTAAETASAWIDGRIVPEDAAFERL